MKRLLIIGLVGVLLVSWCLTPIEAKTKEEIYQEKLAKLEPEDVKGHYKLGEWCKRNKLVKQAQAQFEKVIELNPNHAYARRKLGHFKYKGEWTSPEEMKAQGLVKYKGKWIPYAKMMKAKGMVQFEGQWVTPKEKKRLEARAEKIETLAKQFPFTGVLDKAGADHENLPWEKARTQETNHFIIKTNLSVDALNDLCFVLECVYLNYQDLFGFATSKKKLQVTVLKNQNEYEKIYCDLIGTNPPPSSGGVYIPASEPTNKSKQNHLLIFYNLSGHAPLSSRLLHECVHYATALIYKQHRCYDPPKWFYEGLATYYEASKLEGKRLVINQINQRRLPLIKKAIKEQNYIKLRDFINLSSRECTAVLHYAQGWSLVYFLFNYKHGKYKTGLQAYMEAWKRNEIVMTGIGTEIGGHPQDKPTHLKLFEKCMGVPIDQLEEEWKEYILQLK